MPLMRVRCRTAELEIQKDAHWQWRIRDQGRGIRLRAPHRERGSLDGGGGRAVCAARRSPCRGLVTRQAGRGPIGAEHSGQACLPTLDPVRLQAVRCCRRFHC